MTGVVDRTDEMVVPVRPAAPVRARRRRLPAARLTGRLASRELRRRPGRTALVALMVAVPLAGMVVAAVYARTEPVSPEQEWRRTFGTADFAGSNGPTVTDLPTGARRLVVHRTNRALRTTTNRRATADITDVAMTDPLTDGLVHLGAGRAPQTGDEVLLSPGLARDLGVEVGGRLRLARPDRLDATVVGLGTLLRAPSKPVLVLGPGRSFADLGIEASGGDTVTLIALDHAPRAEDLRYWNVGIGLRPSPAVTGLRVTPDGGDRLMLSWILGTVVLTAAGIVIASAYAISGRRQLTTVGLLGANGAPAAVVRGVLLLQGAITGTLGSLLGLALGTAVLLGARPHLDRIWPAFDGSYRWHLLDLVPIVGLGVVVSTVAAAVPARALARVPVRTALAGRWPLAVIPERLTDAGVGGLTVGIGLLAAGIASTAPGGTDPSEPGFVSWVAVGAAGALLLLLGMGALTPLIVGRLDRMASGLPGRWRLAARSLARRRAHTSALVAAVCASAALSLAAGAYATGARGPLGNGQSPAEAPPDQVRIGAVVDEQRAPVPEAIVQRVAAEVPAAEVFHLTAAGPGDRNAPTELFTLDSREGQLVDALGTAAWRRSRLSITRRPMLANEAALAVYPLSPFARAELDRTGAIAAAGSPATAVIPELLPRPPKGVAVVPGEDAPGLDTILLSPALVNQLDLVTEPGPVVLRAPGPLDEPSRVALRELNASLASPQANARARVTVDVTDPRDTDMITLAERVLAGASVVVTLLVIAVGLSLAAAETRRERELLSVSGAAPGTLAGVSARKAALVVLLGTILAVPVGLLPAWASLDAAGRRDAFALPWPTLVLFLVVVPIVAAAGAGVASAVGQRRRGLAISTLAAD